MCYLNLALSLVEGIQAVSPTQTIYKPDTILLTLRLLLVGQRN